MKNFIISIPEPCHEDWNSMQPDEKGKFCNSCSKSVFDFSTKTDTEIKNILVEYKDQKVCGHFKKSQVNLPLSINVNLKDLPKNISMTKAFAIALFLVFGTFLFSCTDEHGQKVEHIEVVGNRENNNVMEDMSFIPPTDSTMREPEMPLDSIVTTYYSQSSVSGAVSIEEIIYEDVIVVDTVVKGEPVSEMFILGMMEMPYSVKDKTTIVSNDSTITDNTREIKPTQSIIKTTELIIYPNPSNGEFTVKYFVKKKENVLLEIYDMKGILIKTIVDVSNQYEGNYQIPVNLSELTNGIYLVNLIKGDKKFVERLVIER